MEPEGVIVPKGGAREAELLSPLSFKIFIL